MPNTTLGYGATPYPPGPVFVMALPGSETALRFIELYQRASSPLGSAPPYRLLPTDHERAVEEVVAALAAP